MRRSLALATLFLFLAASLALGASSSQPLAPGNSITITCSTQLSGSIGATSATLACAPTPAPSPTPTATPTSTPSGTATFVANAETGNTSQWCYVHSGVPVGVVTSPVRAGSYSFKSEVHDGVLIYNTERSQYDSGPGACPNPHFYYGTESWTGISVYFPANFPPNPEWALITQWKEPNAGTPPQQISIQNDTLQIIGSGTLSPRPRWAFGKVQRGAWTDIAVHQKWSTDPAVGFTEVYLNGVLALPLTHMKTIDDTNPLFLSTGLYRDAAPTTGTAILYIDEIRVGPTRASVTP